MDFKNNISTTREQSQRLIGLGVKPETADMVYHHTNSGSPIFEWELQPHPPVLRGYRWAQDVPSWSLSRLLEMMPKAIDNEENVILMVELPLVIYYDTLYKGMYYFTTYPDIFDNCVNMIAWLIENGHFSEDYLIHSNSLNIGKEDKR